jgi:autotransporter strand-loop-strand O-heptosyltransferase
MDTFLTTQSYINAYNTTPIVNNKIPESYRFKISFLKNPTVEISGNSQDEFLVEFIDGDVVIHSSNIKCGMWTRANREYYTDWRVRITKKGQIVYDQKIDFTDKKVYISLESKSLGDTLAWFPYAEEFRKKHSCKVAISTFMNDLFINQYPDLEFINPGQVVENIHAHYKIGWFYDNGTFNRNLNPKDFRKIPLQQTASDILGLDYKEVSANLPNISTTKKKRVAFAMHSTAQAKYWNNPTGWQEVVNYLIEKGYEVVLYSRENDGYMGNFQPKGIQKFPGGSIKDVISDMSTCEFFIGLGSGLSWLAWSIGLPVVLISGFSEEWAETSLNTYRVINKSVCHGCFNSDRLDAGDWNWCPKHKNTERMFECTKSISSDMVIKEINKIINNENDDSICLVVAHADTKYRKKLLNECLSSIKLPVVLSTNYPVSEENQLLCDYFIYSKNNPLLYKEEYSRYNVSYNYWYKDENGDRIMTPFDFEHGYAAYSLIREGLEFIEKLGYKKVHIINYDYQIASETLMNNSNLLSEYDIVIYKYDEQSTDGYCSGFLSSKLEYVLPFFTKFKTKDSYYTETFCTLEMKLKKYLDFKNLNMFQNSYYTLNENSKVNQEGLLQFSKSKD